MAIEIVQFEPRYARAFAELNYRWIERYFSIEAHDREILDAPDEFIIQKGGRIFFAIEENEPVGTAALIKLGQHSCELSKMAVDPDHQGKGIGNMILAASIEQAKADKMQEIVLESNRILTAAIALYTKFGFVETPLDKNSSYFRANIRMRLVI